MMNLMDNTKLSMYKNVRELLRIRTYNRLSLGGKELVQRGENGMKVRRRGGGG